LIFLLPKKYSKEILIMITIFLFAYSFLGEVDDKTFL